MTRRLPALRPAQLSPEQRALYDAIVGGPRASAGQPSQLVGVDGALAGPFNAMLLAPAIGDALQALGAAIRYRGRLSARIREMAILAVAARWSSPFERRAHEAEGRRVGLTEIEIEALRSGGVPSLADARERVALTAVRALLEAGSLDDPDYESAVRDLGAPELFELTALVGYYATLAMQLRVFSDEG